MPKDAVDWYVGFLKKVYGDAGVQEVPGRGRAQARLRHRPRVREVGRGDRAAPQGPDDQGRAAQEVADRAPIGRMPAPTDVTTALIAAGVGALVVADALRLGHRLGHRRAPERLLSVLARASSSIACCAVIVVQACAPRDRSALRHAASSSRPCSRCCGRPRRWCLLTQFIGLYVAPALYMGFYMRWIGRHAWLADRAPERRRSRCVTFLVFESWFLVPMPKGPLEAWLGLLSAWASRTSSSAFRSRSRRYNLVRRGDRHHARHHHRRAARARAAPTASPSCCRSPSRCRRPRRSSC